MTQQKYKVGDEVLIRAKIFSIADSHEIDKFGYEFDFENGYTIYGSKKDIYSIAPEFEIGEEIEVQEGGDEAYWTKRKFIGYNSHLEKPYICMHTDFEHNPIYWKYARKIQPQVIDKEEDITVIRDGKKYKLVEIE